MSASEHMTDVVREKLDILESAVDRDTLDSVAEDIVKTLSAHPVYEEGWLLRGGEVYEVVASRSEGNDIDDDGPYTIWMAATRDEADE